MSPVTLIRRAEAGTGPWFRARPRRALLVAAILYLGVLALRLLTDNALDAISMLYLFPVALVAMVGGRWLGLAAGGLAVALVALWVLLQGVELSALGWASRVLPLLLVGMLIGDASDRLEEAATEREARKLAQLRQREAVEINDSLVQGMAAAKWAMEAGRHEDGLQLLGETIEQAHRLVSTLIREAGAQSRSLSLEEGA
jgi:K+-sensing histidine kinase KdpD